MITNSGSVLPIATILAIGGTGWAGYEKYEQLAPKEYVHTYVAAATKPIQNDLDRIVAMQIAMQLKEIYRAKCDGYSSMESDMLILKLESEYLQRASVEYRPPSCDFLSRSQS